METLLAYELYDISGEESWESKQSSSRLNSKQYKIN
jgi:hypothetical protein